MYILHIALGGCLKAPPISYGLTEDTGGHIGYVLGAAAAQAERPETWRVDILTRAFDDPVLGPTYAAPREAISDKSAILRLSGGGAGYLSKGTLSDALPAMRSAFLALLRQMPRRPDVIHAHFADAASLAACARRAFGIPFLYTPHSLGIDKARADDADLNLDARIAMERDAIRDADAIVGSSRDETERQIEGYGLAAGGRTHCVAPGTSLPDPSDTTAVQRLIAPFLRHPDRPMVLAIARPVRKKNLVALVQAFGRSPSLRKRANLVILAGQRECVEGGDPEASEVLRGLLAEVDRHDLWGAVALPRRHAPGDVPALYALAAAQGGIFANPALHEPFGLTVIEAARFGLPVVATCNGGPRDILTELDHGRLVDPTDLPAIAAACEALLGDRVAYDRARTNATDRVGSYSWRGWAARVSEIIRQECPPRVAQRRIGHAAHRMLACDIDDTLTGCAAGAVAFTGWVRGRETGRLPFVVATGRSISEARRVMTEWKIATPDAWLTSVGTEIWRPDAGGALRLCRDWAERVENDWSRDAIIASLGMRGLKWQPPHEQRRWKLSLFGTAEEAAWISRLLGGIGLSALVVASHGRFIDILPPNSGKAAALRFEAARRGLQMAQCVAAGDSGNDRDMLMAAGAAILPANALTEIADIADRPHVLRTKARHASGVMEGLTALGLFDPAAGADPRSLAHA